VKVLLLKGGKRLKVVAQRAGLKLAGGECTVGVRVTFGKGTPDEVRICSQFGGGTVTKDEAGKFVGKGAPASALPDCSNASLGTYGTQFEEIPPGVASCGPGFDDVGNSTGPGSDLYRVTLHGALEVCNDGSPAVFYIRPANPGGGHENDWLMWLEGGGGCGDPETCRERWCGIGSQSGHGAAKMSSRWAYPVIRGDGIFSQTEAANRFRDFNMVVALYCSSDNYVGTHTIDVEPGPSNPEGTRIAFHGHYILDAILEKIRTGVTSDDGTATLLPIDENARLLFTGTSGGGEGAIHNVDYVAAFAATIPVASFKAVIDARVGPGVDDTTLLTPTQKETFLTRVAGFGSFRSDVLDASCREHHQAGDLRYCKDSTHVLLHHVAGPLFIRQDLADPVVGPGLFAPSMAAFTTATRTLLETQFLQRPTVVLAEEAALATEPVPVIFAPLCGTHVGLESSTFYDDELELAPDPPTDFNTNLGDWFDGSTPASLIDDVGGAVTNCGP
jgi:hypothetical protein